MRGRIAALAVVVTVAGALFAVQGAQVAGADDHDPVGYSIGTIQHGAGALGGCNFYKIDLKTGAATQVNVGNGSVKCGDGLTYDEDGTLYAYTQRVIRGTGNPTVSELITIDKHTGVQHVVGQLPPVLVGAGGMTFDADGHLWLYALTNGDPSCTPNGTFCLYEVNKKTAAARFVGKAPTDTGVYGLAADCEDVLAITGAGIAGAGTDVGLLHAVLDELNTGSGALKKIADTAIGFPTGLDFDSEDDLWALGIAGSGGAGIGMTLYRVDPNNGNTGPTDITFNGAPFSGQLNGLAVSPISCDDPEKPAPAPQPVPVVVQPVFTG